ALSSQVRRLEETLGIPLFERIPTGVMATAAGERVISLARRVVADVDEIVATAQSMQDPLQGTIRMGVIPTVAPYVLPQLMPSIRKRFPGLRLLLREERTDRLTALVGAGDLDLILVAVESELGDLEVLPLFTDPFVLAVSRDHKLARRKRVTAEDLLGEEVLLLDDGHCLRDQTLAICDAAGACELGDFRATSLSTLVHMVETGVGITLLPAMAVETDRRLGRHLHLVPFGPPVPSRTVALAWRPSSRMREHFEALGRTLVSTWADEPKA
ncbi:MAG: LysR substrate-binding domain-containing protein, partial [Gemmatimonadota bacterium]|nr:LysR substrate-binding domain-containing protein [Gemmatimonadota bacterium]